MPRKPRKLPDYFTMEEANELIQATESGDTRLAMRLMLRCGLRVSEALQVRPSQLRFDRSPPIISLPADIVGNKAKTAREIPIPDDLVEILRDRASGETKARNRPLVELSRQAVGQGGGWKTRFISPRQKVILQVLSQGVDEDDALRLCPGLGERVRGQEPRPPGGAAGPRRLRPAQYPALVG